MCLRFLKIKIFLMCFLELLVYKCVKRVGIDCFWEMDNLFLMEVGNGEG